MDRSRITDAIRANRRLSALLVVAAALLYFGVWRVHPHLLIPDELGAVLRPFLLVEDGAFIDDFEKGGNLHVWVLAAAYVPVVLGVVGYLLATGQFGAVSEQARALESYEGLWAASDAVLSPFYAVVVAGRVVSATAGLAAVLGVALLARRLYGDRAGLLAGAALTTSMGFVLTAHFATEDVLVGSLLVWTYLALARYHDSRRERDLLAGAAVAGLAISAKATAGLVVFAIAALALREHDPRRLDAGTFARKILRYPALCIGTYLLTTPSILVYPRAYVAELARYGGKVSGESTHYASPDPGLVAHTANLVAAQGVALFALSVVAVLGIAALAATGRVTGFSWYLLGFVVPYFLVITSWQNVQYNRALLLLPLLAVLVGGFGGWLLDHDRRAVRRAAAPVLAGVLLVSFVYTGAAVAGFNQSRAEATAWTHANFDADTDVATLGQRIYLPEFPAETEVDRTEILMERNRSEWVGGLRRVQCNQPEYLVLTSFQYTRYFQDPTLLPEVSATYEGLLAEEEYTVVKTFGPTVNRNNDAAGKVRRALRLEPPAKNTGNPRILVMKRTAEPEADCPGT